MKNKRAAYINRNNELIQEFRFTHPFSLMEINGIYNSHFTGSPIWDLFCPEVESLYKSWNVSIRRMFNLPREAHRYLIEPISNQVHLKHMLSSRFFKFIAPIENSIKSSIRSITGRNLQRIMTEMGNDSVDFMKSTHYNSVYKELPESQLYRVQLATEVIHIKNNELEVPGFDHLELDEILSYICVS